MFYDDGAAKKAESTHRELTLGCENVDSPQQVNSHSSGDKYCVCLLGGMKSIAGPGRMPWAGGIVYCERSESSNSVLYLLLSGDRQASCLVSAGGLRFCGLSLIYIQNKPWLFQASRCSELCRERISSSSCVECHSLMNVILGVLAHELSEGCGHS